MGVGGMFVQGVLVRVTVAALGEELTLLFAMGATAAGFTLLSYTTSLVLLVPALSLIAVGYGLAVPCITTLFSHVPVEQGVMQGIAGAIDRFGQAFGPVVGGSLLHLLGGANLLRGTSASLALVSAACLCFIGEGGVLMLCRPRRPGVPGAGYAQIGEEDDRVVVADDDEADADVEMSALPRRADAGSSAPALSNGAHADGGGDRGKVQPVQAQPAGG